MSGYEGVTENGVPDGMIYENGMWNGSNPEDMYIGDMQYGDFNGLGDAPMDFDGAMIDPTLLSNYESLPTDKPSDVGIPQYPVSSSSISNLITQQQIANNHIPSPSSTPIPHPQNHHTISPALLQTTSKPKQPTAIPSGRPTAASPLSAKALDKKPSMPDIEDQLENLQLVNTLTNKESLISSLNNVPNVFTKLVDLLKVRPVPANADPKQALLLSRPRVLLEGEMPKLVFGKINKAAPSRYLKAWAKDSEAMGILFFYLQRTAAVGEDESELAEAMRSAQEILVLLLKLDKYEYSMEVAADYKMGNLIKSVSKPNKRFEVKNRLEATDIRKLLRQVLNALKVRIEAENLRRVAVDGAAPPSTYAKREAPDEATDQKNKKIRSESLASSSKTKPVHASASSNKLTSTSTTSAKKGTADNSFFDAPALAPAPSRTIPAKAVPRPVPKIAVDAYGSTLKTLLGTLTPAGQAGQMAAEKAAQQAVTPKMKLGPDGKLKPRRSVTFAPEAELEKIMWIEARADAGHHVSTRDFDAQEGRVLKQHAVQEDQSWYQPDELFDAPLPDGEEKIELFSEARYEWERLGEPKFDLNAPSESLTALSSPNEQNVQEVSVVWSGTEPTKVMTPYLGLPVENGQLGGHNHAVLPLPAPPAPQSSFIGSPYQQIQPPGPSPVDVGALLQNLSSVLPPQQTTPAQYPPAATNQDLTSLLAGLQQQQQQQQQHIQQPAPTQWPPMPQQYPQQARQAYGYPNDAGWASHQSDGFGGGVGVSESGGGRGRGGFGGGRGRGGGGGGNRVPPPQSSDKICSFYRREGQCKYGNQCIDRHIK